MREGRPPLHSDRSERRWAFSRTRTCVPSNLGVRPPGFPRGKSGEGRVFCGARTLLAPPARTLLAPLGASTFLALTCVSYLARTARTLSGPSGRMRARHALARARDRKVTRLRVCSDVSQQGPPIAVDGHDVPQPRLQHHRHAGFGSVPESESHPCSFGTDRPRGGVMSQPAVERERLVTRPPRALAELVAQRAADQGVSVSTYLTEELARLHDFELPEYRTHRPARRDEGGRMSA